jgi:hypothetical protein
MRHSNRLIKYLPPVVLAFSLLLIYLKSMAPGLTWANHGSDGGDLITAAATGGVAHPSGYPTYLFLAVLFQMFPVGSLAFRTNMMSALTAVAASELVYFLILKVISSSIGTRSWLPGLAAAFTFGLSPLLWSQAVITEVYTLHAFFVMLILYLSIQDLPLLLSQKRTDCLTGLVFGLAMGNHLTTILLLPLLLPRVHFDKVHIFTGDTHSLDSAGFYGKTLLRRLVWLGLGLLVYLTLPLRALKQLPVNWGNPGSLKGFVWLVSGSLYQDQLFALTFTMIWSRIQIVASMLIGQFGIPGLVLGLIGLIVFYKPSNLYRNTAWIFIVFSVFSIVYATEDSFIYLIPAYLSFAIWIGLGISGLMEIHLPKSYDPRLILSLIYIAYIFILAGTHWKQVDASQDMRAEQFSRDVLNQAPKNSIVFAKGDPAVFAIWYFHYALHDRPDLVVVATDLLAFDWYQEMLHRNYPALVLRGPFPFPETVASDNSNRPICYIEYNQEADIQCAAAKYP